PVEPPLPPVEPPLPPVEPPVPALPPDVPPLPPPSSALSSPQAEAKTSAPPTSKKRPNEKFFMFPPANWRKASRSQSSRSLSTPSSSREGIFPGGRVPNQLET